MENKNKKLSLTFRMLRALGFNYSETAYGNVTFFGVIKKVFVTFRNNLLESWMDCWIFAPVLPRKMRPWIMRKWGCKVGKGCFIGDHVRIDIGHADMITLEDSVSIAGGTRLLCHQRDFSDYCVGDDYMKLGYTIKPIILKKGCLVGMESFVMPGVTIGEGAVVAAGSMVTKDLPAWTVAMGRPAKVVKQIPDRVK
ncbi:acyltransferase [Sodaliphilus sp.]|uniref:acyltransferase n=1 Tax=Sodaliphilus sp. TaxID=2815818 RepID=UPI00388E85A1